MTDGPTGVEPAPPRRAAPVPRGPRLSTVVGVAVVVGALVWGVVLVFSGEERRTPGNASAEAGFARDLTVLQREAATLADQQKGRTKDADLRHLASTLGEGADARITRMQAWLDNWRLAPTSSRNPLAWLGHTEDMPGMEMSSPSSIPGMASALELNRLRRAGPGAGDVLFLQLMVRHQQGDVALASAILARTDRPEVRSLARSLIADHGRETRAMTARLERVDAIALPPPVMMTASTRPAPAASRRPGVVARTVPFVVALAGVVWLVASRRRRRHSRGGSAATE